MPHILLKVSPLSVIWGQKKFWCYISHRQIISHVVNCVVSTGNIYLWHCQVHNRFNPHYSYISCHSNSTVDVLCAVVSILRISSRPGYISTCPKLLIICWLLFQSTDVNAMSIYSFPDRWSLCLDYSYHYYDCEPLFNPKWDYDGYKLYIIT